MKIQLFRATRSLLIPLLIAFFFSLFPQHLSAGSIPHKVAETDGNDYQLVGFFDLRNRETYIQITNTGESSNQQLLVQIFDVNNDCSINGFFDTYTPNDTHIYNLRDLQANDGNPTGLTLGDNAYGILVVTLNEDTSKDLMGIVRMTDDKGYEYRTNMQGIGSGQTGSSANELIMNFSEKDGNRFSDIFGIVLEDIGITDPPGVSVADVENIWHQFQVDLFNENEVKFLCPNIAFSCVNQNHPRLSSLLDNASDSEVVSFDFGINEEHPSSKGAPLICPNNTVSNGIILLTLEETGESADGTTIVFLGLNNGNGRGSMDSFWK